MHIGDVAGTAWYYVFQVIQVAFFGALFIHISSSFAKAFITLGILQDIKKEKMISNAAALISAILWMIMSIVVVSTYNRVYMGA
jgi:succinate dehydrogenase/fumarate reductase cytochrome b subunit